MNGKGIGVFNVATGITLFPVTRDSRPLFIVAASFFVCGTIILSASLILAHKSRKSETQAS